MASTVIPMNGVSGTRHADGGIVFDARRGLLFSLNGTAALMWQGVVAGRTVEGIAADVTRAHRVPEAVALRATVQFISSLRQQRLVVGGQQ